MCIGQEESGRGLFLDVAEVQLLTWLEADGFAGGDRDFGARAGIATDARFAGPDGEDAKAAQLDAVACGKGLFEAAEYGIDCLFCFDTGYAGPLNYLVHDVLLDHVRSPQKYVWQAVPICAVQFPRQFEMIFSRKKSPLNIVSSGYPSDTTY